MGYYSDKIVKLMHRNELPISKLGIPLITAPLMRTIYHQGYGNLGGRVARELIHAKFEMFRQNSITPNMVDFSKSIFVPELFFSQQDTQLSGPLMGNCRATGGWAILPQGTKAILDTNCNPYSVLHWPSNKIEIIKELYLKHFEMLGLSPPQKL